MPNPWPVLLPILLTDVVNPVLFSSLVYAAGSSRGIVNSTALLLGHTVAYLGVGIALLSGLEAISARLAAPQPLDYGIQLVVGVVLVIVALPSRKSANRRGKEPSAELTPAGAFSFGAVVNFVGLPFAVPYFAALSQILGADLGSGGSLLSLMLYNLAYALPFAIVPVFVALFGERSPEVLREVSSVLDRASGFLMPILLFVVGVVLTADAGAYLAFDRGFL